MTPSILPPVNSLQLRKHRHASALSTTPLKGDNADDYTTPVYIDGQGPFSLNVDTGSALVGVAGNETIGCDLYYDSSACDGGAIKVVYGSGFWSGVVCEATVTLGAYNVTNYKFGAYQKQKAMTTCERTHEDDATSPRHMTQPHNYMQGIVGLTAGEVGRTAGSPPLLEVLFATHADVDPLFGLQCCAVWKSTSASGAPDNSSLSHFSAMTRPSWLGRAVRNQHRHAIEQASRRWRGGRRDDAARTRRKILISTQVAQALAKVDEATDPAQPLSKEDFVDDLALTSMARLWDVGKSEPIKVGKASPRRPRPARTCSSTSSWRRSTSWPRSAGGSRSM